MTGGDRADVCLAPLGETCRCPRCVDCRVVASPPDPHGHRWVSVDLTDHAPRATAVTDSETRG